MLQKAMTKSSTDDLLRDLLIVQLALAGITQHQIRKIVGGEMRRVTRIAKYIRKTKGALQ
jgi:translation initiation factor RLI1